MSTIPILGLTCQQFVLQIMTHLSRGSVHSEKAYKAFLLKGDPLLAKDSKEPQAASLIESIADLIKTPQFKQKSLVQEGEIKKYLLEFEDGLVSESVLIPMGFGKTLCISSQVGCKMGCAFCTTAKMGLLRHLSAEEIVLQVFYAKTILKEPIRNIVFMGMGEPFDNYDNVMQAIRVLTDPKGLNFGSSRITVSTSGLVPFIYRFSDEADPSVRLAVSVNAPTDEIRKKIMPVNKEWDMAELKKAMLYYCRHPKKEILIEYVLLQGVNDSLEDCESLISYLKGLKVRINLIPFNPQARGPFAPPTHDQCQAFLKHLRSHNLPALLRGTKGQGIMAACGQLGEKVLKLVQV